MNRNNNFQLTVDETAFVYQDLKINVDGVPPVDEGRRTRLYDLPRIIIIENTSAYTMIVRWMDVDEGDGTDGEWNGTLLTPGTVLKITMTKQEENIFRVGAKMNVVGTGVLNINGNDYQNIFE